MKILSLDIATRTGWSVGSNDNPKVCRSGHWDFSLAKDESADMRLFKFRKELNTIKALFDIEMVVFEAVRFAGPGSGRAVICQSEMQGLLKCWCKDNELPYKGYSSKEIKKHATGNGNASKEKMVDAAIKRWKKIVESEDEADSLGLLSLAMERFADL